MLKKKSDRPFYALATSSISDIPEITHNRFSQNQYYYENSDYKYGNSPFNDSLLQKSHRDQSINLNFSTSKPFYQQLSPYWNRNQHQQYYHKNQSDYSNQTSNIKKLNNKLIKYSYSNFVILSNHINKITKKIKQNAFQYFKKYHKSENRQNGSDRNTRHSQISRTTNETNNENIFYNKKTLKKRVQDKQQCIQSANLIKRWLDYHLLIIYRRGFNFIFQYGEQKQYESSSEFENSAKKDRLLSQRFNLTQNNSYARSNPHIEESLVYTIQNNNQSIRRDTNSFMFDSNPTFKKIPKFQKKKQHLQQISKITNQHSFVYKDKQMLKYYIKQIKLKIIQPLVLPKITKPKQKNFKFSQLAMELSGINQKENVKSLKQQRLISSDIFTPNKADIDHESQLQSIKQILHDGSYMMTEQEDQIPPADSKYSNSSSVEQNQHFGSLIKEKIHKNNSQLNQNSSSDIQINNKSKAKEGTNIIQFKSPTINHLQEQKLKTQTQTQTQTQKINKQLTPIGTLYQQNNNKESKLIYVKSQQNLHNQHEQFIRLCSQKRLDELENDRIRINNAQRNKNIYHQKPIYYTNKNIPQYSSIILTQPQKHLINDNMYTSNRVIGPKMPTEKIIVHPTIKQPGTIVSQRRLINKDLGSISRQNSNAKSQTNLLQNANCQPCIYYHQNNKKMPNAQLINSHAVRTNNSKIIEHRSLSPKINLRPQSSLKFTKQQDFKSPQGHNTPLKIISFPEKHNKKPFLKMQEDYMMQNSQATQRPIYQNYPKPTNQNLKMKHPLRVRSPNERKPVFANQYQLVQNKQRINFPQHQINNPHNLNMNFHQQNNNRVPKIYCLSSDQKIYQRPNLSVQSHLQRPQKFISNQSRNDSQNFSNYTQQLSVRTQIKRPKSSNKKLQVTLKAK